MIISTVRELYESLVPSNLGLPWPTDLEAIPLDTPVGFCCQTAVQEVYKLAALLDSHHQVQEYLYHALITHLCILIRG